MQIKSQTGSSSSQSIKQHSSFIYYEIQILEYFIHVFCIRIPCCHVCVFIPSLGKGAVPAPSVVGGV